MALGRKTGGRRPGSPNKATADVKAAAAKYTTAALETLAQIMKAGESEGARVAAANSLLDRAHGKPKQSVDVEGNMTHEVTDARERLARHVSGVVAARSAGEGVSGPH